MKLTLKIMAVAALVLAGCTTAPHYMQNREPLVQTPMLELPIGAIRPSGWLKEQLQRQADGLTGHMDSVYAIVDGPRNAWLGGDGDCWERGPYWIDGLLPLAYILDDGKLKEKVQPWIEYTLSHQKENGFFGPDTDRPHEPGIQRGEAQDWWPRMVMLKVMKQYYMASGDERVITFMTKYFHYQLEQLPDNPLDKWTYWGAQRGGDNLEVVYWLYNITGEPFLLDLGEIIHQQSNDWVNILGDENHPYEKQTLHCVNLGQGFKEPAVYYQASRDPHHLEVLKIGENAIRRTVGFPTGLWGGDEMIHTSDPSAGSELCTAIEMMFSLEEITRITGDTHWADYLERVAFNALPTQITDDFSGKQYYQQVNQPEVTRKVRPFTTTHEDTDILFGETTGYPCCLSNMHQGWPKFTQNLWYATPDRGAAAMAYAPCNVTMKVGNGETVNITEDTAYPFDETIRFVISYPEGDSHASFPLKFRIPEWCDNASVTVNGTDAVERPAASEIVCLDRKWKDGDMVELHMPMGIRISRWHEGRAVVERGPLVYALKMNENWQKKCFEDDKVLEFGPWYYEVTSDTPYDVSLSETTVAAEDPGTHFKVVKNESESTYPWNLDSAPVELVTEATDSRGEKVQISLIPYGCTTLRITEFDVK